MVLLKSALREAIGTGDIRILNDDGTVPEEWAIGPAFSMPDNPTTLSQMVEDSVYQGFRFFNGDPEALQPASIDLHLGDEWLIPKPNLFFEGGEALDTARKIQYQEVKSPSITVPANGFILARTQEVIQLSDELAAFIEGRSSFGRAGIFCQNAGYVDGGFKGSLTLEILNANSYPAILYVGTKFGQLVVMETEGDAEGGYKGQYQGQINPKGSELHRHVPKGK